MPPIRTAKKNTVSSAQAPTDNPPKRTPLKSIPRSVKDAQFRSSSHDWDGKYEQVIGTSTRNIVFGTIMSTTSWPWETQFAGRSCNLYSYMTTWVPKLKKLILGEEEDNKPFMKVLRCLTKERPRLTVALLQRDEIKKWGDWDLEETKMTYKKGRLAWLGRV